ncbi:MAG: metal-dependent hydrolase, partial [Gemmatimonadaceae bacterium]
MPSSIAHGLAAGAIGTAFFPAERALYVAAVAAAILLDLDAVGWLFGRGDVAFLGGHRGLTHSLAFAAVLTVALVALLYRGTVAHSKWRLALCLFLAIASHGALDALTTYGAGIRFLAPFSAERFKFPWQPIDAMLPEVIG